MCTLCWFDLVAVLLFALNAILLCEESMTTNYLMCIFLDNINGDSVEELCSNPQMEKLVLIEIQKHSTKSRLEKFEIPQAVKLVPDVWTPDMGLVTAAFKLKRKNIQDRYQILIDRMYS